MFADRFDRFENGGRFETSFGMEWMNGWISGGGTAGSVSSVQVVVGIYCVGVKQRLDCVGSGLREYDRVFARDCYVGYWVACIGVEGGIEARIDGFRYARICWNLYFYATMTTSRK